MHDSVALQRYLQRHTETGLPRHSFAQSSLASCGGDSHLQGITGLAGDIDTHARGQRSHAGHSCAESPRHVTADTQANAELRTALQ